MKRNKWKWMSVVVTGTVMTVTATTAAAKGRAAQGLKCTVNTNDGLSHEVELSPDRSEGDEVNVNDEYKLLASRMKHNANEILLRLATNDGSLLGHSRLLNQKKPSTKFSFKFDGESVLHRVACEIEFAPEPSRKVSGHRIKIVQALTPEVQRELNEAIEAADAK